MSPVEGILSDTTGTGFGIQRIVSASSDVFDDDLSQTEKENHRQIYTVPMKKNDKFETNLLNDAAADDLMMNEIIDHMNTPMGDQDPEIDDDDDTPTVEMQEINTAGGEHDQEIDDIDNNPDYGGNARDNDDDLINDIDGIAIGVTAGNDDEDIIEGTDDDVVHELDDIVTPQDPVEEGGMSIRMHIAQESMTLGGDDNDHLLKDDEFVIEDDDDSETRKHDEFGDIGTDTENDDNDVIQDVDNFVKTIQ